MPAQSPVSRRSIHPKNIVGGGVQFVQNSGNDRPFPTFLCSTLSQRDSLVVTELDYLATVWVEQEQQVYILLQTQPRVWVELNTKFPLDAGEF